MKKTILSRIIRDDLLGEASNEHNKTLLKEENATFHQDFIPFCPRETYSEKSKSRAQVLIWMSILLGILYYSIWPISIFKYAKLDQCSRNSSRVLERSTSSSILQTQPLKVFQVYQPVTLQYNATNQDSLSTTLGQVVYEEGNLSGNCQIELMNYSFANSYGKPFVRDYTPPPCKFNRVVMNFTATSQGRQFDRLAIMYLSDIEVWRTSTAEPTQSGIIFEYIKDMSAYMSLWTSPQKLIFDLGNLIDETYTGPFHTTLTVTYSMVNSVNKPADLIIPVSLRKSGSNSSSVFKLPPDDASNSIILPRNANRAVFSISSCGQGMEEFWWQNVLQSSIETFKNDNVTLYGYSPFREVQLLIDSQIAGVQWPFPVIFTGGVSPGLWRPIVGIDAYDLREHEIDISPWLSIISDGAPHKFEIRVVGIQDDGGKTGTLSESVGDNWLVTGKIFLWLDPGEGTITSGSKPDIKIGDPIIDISSSLTQDATGANDSLTYTVNVKRTIFISSTINTVNGSQLVSWTQNLNSTNFGRIEERGDIQVNEQTTIGTDESAGSNYYKSVYSYPLRCRTNGTSNDVGDNSFDSEISRGLALSIEGNSVYPTGIESFLGQTSDNQVSEQPIITYLETTQNGTAHFSSSKSAKTSISYGETSQEYGFFGSSPGLPKRELYYRNVAALNGSLTNDQERILGEESNPSLSITSTSNDDLVFPLDQSENLVRRFLV